MKFTTNSFENLKTFMVYFEMDFEVVFIPSRFYSKIRAWLVKARSVNFKVSLSINPSIK